MVVVWSKRARAGLLKAYKYIYKMLPLIFPNILNFIHLTNLKKTTMAVGERSNSISIGYLISLQNRNTNCTRTAYKSFA